MAKASGTDATVKGAKPVAAPKAVKEPKPVRELVTVKAGALSVDVGPTVIAGLSKSYDTEQKANALMMEVESKRYDMLSQLTAGIVKAAKADDSIDLAVTFKGDPKLMNVLNDQLGLALGFREVETVKDAGGNEIKRIATAKAVTKYFGGPKDDKTSPEGKRRATVKTNFLHMLKKCAQAASGLIESDTKFSQDKETGTLQISGPAVKKAFGQETVLLNEKVTVGDGDDAVKLSQKPSFTAVARMGAEAAGKVLETRKQSGVSGTATDPAKSLQAIAKSLADACSKIKLPADDETKRALSIASNAIDKVLQGSLEKTAPAAA